MTSSCNGFPLKAFPSAAAEMAPVEGMNVHLALEKHGPAGVKRLLSHENLLFISG